MNPLKINPKMSFILLFIDFLKIERVKCGRTYSERETVYEKKIMNATV